MKHIKKRFLLENEESSFEKRSDIEIVDLRDGFDNRVLDNKKKTVAYIVTEDGKTYGGFVHKVSGKNYIFPVPDLTLIYFHNAQINIRQIEKYKSELLTKLDYERSMTELTINEIYNYYSAASGFVIFLFTSMESFINQMIPEDFQFKKELANKTEIYSNQQIQKSLDFKVKVTEVLKQITDKNFFAKLTVTNQFIWNLKDFRDEIVHTKATGNELKYDKLIKMSLSFKYSEALDSVAKFMNFYRPDYIIECSCGIDL